MALSPSADAYPVMLVHASTGAEYPVHNEGELANLVLSPEPYLLKQPVPGLDLRVYEPPSRTDWPDTYQPPRRAELATADPPTSRRRTERADSTGTSTRARPARSRTSQKED